LVWWFGCAWILFIKKHGFCSQKLAQFHAKTVLFKKQYLSTSISLLTKLTKQTKQTK
jgi:hypothetical protein